MYKFNNIPHLVIEETTNIAGQIYTLQTAGNMTFVINC